MQGPEVTNTFSEPLARTFMVRGPTYTTDGGVKIPSAESLFALLGVDNVLREDLKREPASASHHYSSRPNSYLARLRASCDSAHIETPFLLVLNLVVPWGNLIAYFYRPIRTKEDASRPLSPAERLWEAFLNEPDADVRNDLFKLVPRVVRGPWVVKKAVGSAPVLLGKRLPITCHGSAADGYLEVVMDVTQGGGLGNSIASTCANKASLITVDLAWVLQGGNETNDGAASSSSTLPETLLGAYRLHHVAMKKGYTAELWDEELKRNGAGGVR